MGQNEIARPQHAQVFNRDQFVYLAFKISQYKTGVVEDTTDPEFNEEFSFNPVDLRTKRQAALANAMTTPPFRERSATQDIYPFVFDSLAKKKLAAGFIKGVKMSLPTGFERKDDRTYEEVSIPATESASVVDIGRKLVPIEALDEIGRAAFAGMKSLNRIQSVVCDSAYRTSENMLVCAPTGDDKIARL